MLVIYDFKFQICWLEGLLLVYGIPVYRAFGIPSCRDTGNLRQRYGRIFMISNFKLQICWLEGLLLVYGIPVYRAFGIPSCRDTGNLRQRYGRVFMISNFKLQICCFRAGKVRKSIYDFKFQISNFKFVVFVREKYGDYMVK